MMSHIIGTGSRGRIYWVGQKVCLGFSIRCYGKNFLANAIFGGGVIFDF